MDELTAGERRVLNAIKDAGKPIAGYEIKSACSKFAYRVINKLHDAGIIYIAGWRIVENGRKPAALYAYGKHADAIYNATDQEVLRERKRIRNKRYYDKRAAELAEDNMPLPPPSLPKKTPMYNFWGI